MARRGRPPGGETLNHKHTRTGDGGDTLNPDALGLGGDEPFDFGNVEVEFRPAVGTSGALVFRDTATGEDRFFIEVNDVARFANQAMQMPDDLEFFLGDDQDISMAFDTAVGANGGVVFRDEGNAQDRLEIRVGDVMRLLGQGLDVNGQDIEDSGTTVWDSAAGEVPAAQIPSAFVQDGDGVDRAIWLINNGGSDPAGSGNNDLIFERE